MLDVFPDAETEVTNNQNVYGDAHFKVANSRLGEINRDCLWRIYFRVPKSEALFIQSVFG